MNAGRSVRRLGRILVHNWPLKLAAVVLATLIYAGFVASQDSSTFPGRIPVTVANQADDTVLTDGLRDIERIRYVADPDLGPLRASDFRATVDLRNVEPNGETVNVRVDVSAPPGVGIIEVFPSAIPVTLDRKVTRAIDVTVLQSERPDGIAVGEVVVTPRQVEISGASASVNRVAVAQVTVTIDASEVNIDRDLQPVLLDANGNPVEGVEVTPALVNIELDVFTNLENRSVPVNPVVTGTPGAGFRVAGISVDPLTVTVEGDLDQIQDLVTADTAPVVISGATRDVTAEVAWALPAGVTAIAAPVARVTVRIQAVTETRTFTAGIRLDDRDAALQYEPADTEVLLTLFGSIADLDRLSASPLVISVDVGDLEPGVHEVPVVPAVDSAIRIAAISPETITVTVTPRPTQPPPTLTPDLSPPATTSPAPEPTTAP